MNRPCSRSLPFPASETVKNEASLAKSAFFELGAPFLVLLHAGKRSAPLKHLFGATRLVSNIRRHDLVLLTCDKMSTFQCSKVAPHESCRLISSYIGKLDYESAGIPALFIPWVVV
jgi:hypothetical protein